MAEELDRRLRVYLKWIRRTRPSEAIAYSHNPELYFEAYERGFVDPESQRVLGYFALTPEGEDFIVERLLRTIDYRLDYKSKRGRNWNRSIEISVSADFPRWVNVDVGEIIRTIIGGGALVAFPDGEWVIGELKEVEGDEVLGDKIEVEIEYTDYDRPNLSWSDYYNVDTVELGVERAFSSIRKDIISGALDVAETNFSIGLSGKKKGRKTIVEKKLEDFK